MEPGFGRPGVLDRAGAKKGSIPFLSISLPLRPLTRDNPLAKLRSSYRAMTIKLNNSKRLEV